MCKQQNLKQVKQVLKEVKFSEQKITLGTALKCLQECALSGNIKIARELISCFPKLNLNNDTVISNAISNDHLRFIKFLHEKGANIHSGDENMLFHAVKCGNKRISKYLLSQGANLHIFDDYILCIASGKEGKGDVGIVKLLFSYGIQVYDEKTNKRDSEALRMALEARHTTIAKYLVSKGANAKDNLSLCIAGETGNLVMVKLLIKHGANPEENYCLVLRKVVSSKESESVKLQIVKYLLSKCKSLNTIVESKTESSREAFTYLIGQGASFRAFL